MTEILLSPSTITLSASCGPTSKDNWRLVYICKNLHKKFLEELIYMVPQKFMIGNKHFQFEPSTCIMWKSDDGKSYYEAFTFDGKTFNSIPEEIEECLSDDE